MTNFVPVSKESVKAIILNMHNKTCSLDVIPTWLLKEVVNSLIPILHFIVNLSLSKSHILSCLKHFIITPVVKNSNLNTNEYKSFCPMSNLSFVSKLIEKCVYLQIQSYLEYNYLFCQFQSTVLVTAVKQPLPSFTMIYYLVTAMIVNSINLIHGFPNFFGHRPLFVNNFFCSPSTFFIIFPV